MMRHDERKRLPEEIIECLEIEKAKLEIMVEANRNLTEVIENAVNEYRKKNATPPENLQSLLVLMHNGNYNYDTLIRCLEKMIRAAKDE